jgi:aryl-alcohol dehydrogenase-like predicted oxidoreductase
VIIGNWFEKTKKRDKVILASKVCGPMREYVRGGGNQFGEKNITEALEGSLKRLKTNCIDLYQLHWPERKTNFFGKLGYEHDDNNEWTRFEDILGYLKRFIDQGKIKHVGLSNETSWGLSKFLELSKDQNLPRVLSIQNPYNLLNRTYEVGLAEMSVREQAGLLAYSPLACGYLSGKYRENKLPKNSRIERDGDFWTRYQKPNMNMAVDAYYKISKKHNLDMSQMSLKFIEIQPFITSVIIGATTMEQLKKNIESVNIKLTDEIINEINEVQAIYPNPCP